MSDSNLLRLCNRRVYSVSLSFIKPVNNIRQAKAAETAKYKNQCVGYFGPGNIFGASDVVKSRNSELTYKVNQIGTQCFCFAANQFQSFFCNS
jgi:hypothetical protein